MRAASEIMAQLAGSALTPEQLALVMELSAAVATEARPIVDIAAHRRRERDREYQAERRQSRQKSADAADAGNPPNEYISNPPIPSSNELGDPEKIMFDSGVELLTSAGTSAAKARTMLGKWKRDYGPADVIAALGAAKREGAIEPLSFVEATLRNRAKQQAPPVWNGMA